METSNSGKKEGLKRKPRKRNQKIGNRNDDSTCNTALKQLVNLFPDVPREIIVSVLCTYNNDVHSAAEYILAFQSPEILQETINDNIDVAKIAPKPVHKKQENNTLLSAELYKCSTKVSESAFKYNNWSGSTFERIYYDSTPLDIFIRPHIGYLDTLGKGGAHHQRTHQQFLKGQRHVARDIKAEEKPTLIEPTVAEDVQ